MSTQLTVIQHLEQKLPDLMAVMGLNASPGTDLRTLVLQEIQYVAERCVNNPAIAECSIDSVVQCVRKAIKNNLTLDPAAGLMYMIPGSVKNASGGYSKVLESPLTVNGSLSVAYQCGTILDHERPVVEYNDKGQVIAVSVKILRPSFPAPRWEPIQYDNVYFKRWMAASHKKNARGKQDADATKLNYANALYRSHNGWIDPEFAIAKSLRHAIEKLGTNQNSKHMNTITLAPEKKVVVEPETEYAEELPTGEYAATMIISPADGTTPASNGNYEI